MDALHAHIVEAKLMIYRLIYVLFVAGSILLAPLTAHAQDSPTFREWKSALAAKIANGKRYPPQAHKNGIEGYVIVEFTIDRSGAIINKRIDRTSCSAALDREALAALQRAAPLPPIPAYVEGPTATLKMPMMFLLGIGDHAAAVERVMTIRCREISAVTRAQAG